MLDQLQKSIGENIGLLVDGVFGWLGVWGKKQKIKQDKIYNDFKNTLVDEIEKVPPEHLKEPEMYVVGPAIESI